MYKFYGNEGNAINNEIQLRIKFTFLPFPKKERNNILKNEKIKKPKKEHFILNYVFKSS